MRRYEGDINENKETISELKERLRARSDTPRVRALASVVPIFFPFSFLFLVV